MVRNFELFRSLRIRKWRNYWREDCIFRKKIRHSKAFFNFESSYRLIKLFTRVDKERGNI